jgi:hypothetical protein
MSSEQQTPFQDPPEQKRAMDEMNHQIQQAHPAEMTEQSQFYQAFLARIVS